MKEKELKYIIDREKHSQDAKRIFSKQIGSITPALLALDKLSLKTTSISSSIIFIIIEVQLDNISSVIINTITRFIHAYPKR